MAKVIEKETVGFDPLAWMNEDQVDQQESSIISEKLLCIALPN